MVIGLVSVFVSSIFLLEQNANKLLGQGPGPMLAPPIPAPAEGTNTECDLKDVQYFSYCDNEAKLIWGLKCSTCEKGKCKWYVDQLVEGNRIRTDPGISVEDKNNHEQSLAKALANHTAKECYYEINKLIKSNFKCSCCGSPLKDFVETDLVNKKNQCIFCGSDKISKKEYCVKWVYGCPDGHKGILVPGQYQNQCPELIKDANGKMTPCRKPLEKIEISIAEVTYKYVCPSCKKAFDKSGQCPTCKKTLTKTKTCAKSGQLPHINEKEWEKEQKTKRDELKKAEGNK